MKTLLNKISLITILAFIIGCSDTEKTIDEVFEGTTRGTVLKTIDEQTSLEFNVGGESLVTVAAEVIDQRGQDVDRIDVYMSFFDNQTNINDPINNSIPEELYTSVPASELDNSGEYPVFDFRFTGDEFNSFFGLTADDYTGGDRINVRLELVMNDGRVFTSTNVNNVVSGGAFYRSPFQYNVNFVCPADTPASGTWTIEMQDSYGDGWNGGELIVSIDGNETSYTMDDGTSKTINFDVPSSAGTISIVYASGSWDSEVTFQVFASNGNAIIEAGPNPPAGIELINYCNRNYQ
ncbi:hypothetical protein [Psychroflexus sediminis]|uniref:Uncharacterized protein n=1 Tax=Psychroflexus sediminis TaxID=470826 RepID=A0A1G7U397_9FLAO|nr:hypothetical protein [Psychroflexus sediminis]SDG41917.1 hypothetical protein SAMN04488027_101222 [Psychroflexus sediminis]